MMLPSAISGAHIMPRREANNPTERIERILEEFETFYTYARNAIQLLMPYAPLDVVQQTGSEPPIVEYHLERQRQQLSGRRVILHRQAMRNVRARRAEGHFIHATGNFTPKIGEEIVSSLSEAARRRIDAEVAATKLRAWQPKRCPVGTDGVCPMQEPENCVCLHPELA
jgi:hypothetical protein